MATRESRLAAARAAYKKCLEACKANPTPEAWEALREAGRELEKADGSYKREQNSTKFNF